MEEFLNKMIIPRQSKRPKIIKLPQNLVDFLLTQNITQWQGRIVLTILSSIKAYQLSDEKEPENRQQLDLFRLYWSDDNSTATFNFHFQDFVPEGLSSYKRGQIEQALKDLVTIGLAEQEEIIEGKNKKRFTGVIFNPIWESRAHTCSFQMTASWFKLFMIAIPYQSRLVEEAMNLTSRGFKFLHLLGKYEWRGNFYKTKKDLCVHFNIEATRKSILERDYLFPIREELDNKGELSFNWKYNEEKQRFDFTIYRLKNANADKKIPAGISVIQPNFDIQSPNKRKIVEEKKIAINAAIKYIIKSRELTKEQAEVLFNLCMKYGYEEIKGIIKNTTKNNVENSFKGLKGYNFINKILYKYPL